LDLQIFFYFRERKGLSGRPGPEGVVERHRSVVGKVVEEGGRKGEMMFPEGISSKGTPCKEGKPRKKEERGENSGRFGFLIDLSFQKGKKGSEKKEGSQFQKNRFYSKGRKDRCTGVILRNAKNKCVDMIVKVSVVSEIKEGNKMNKESPHRTGDPFPFPEGWWRASFYKEREDNG